MRLQQIPNRIKALVLTLACVGLWALIPVVAKTGQTNLDNHQFLFWSSLISFIVLLLATMIKGKFKTLISFNRKEYAKLSLLGFLGTYLYYLLLYFGYSKSRGMDVLVIQYTWPLLMVFFSIFLLKERLTLRKTFSICMGFAGVVTVLIKGNIRHISFSDPGILLIVLMGSCCFALFSVLGKAIQQSPHEANTIYFGIALISSFISMLLFSEFKNPSTGDLFPLLINGIFINGLSYLMWFQALRFTEASFVAPFTYITPGLSAVYLIIFFDEPFDESYAIGIFAIIVAGLLNQTDKTAKVSQDHS